MSRYSPVWLTLVTFSLLIVKYGHGQESRENQLIESLNAEKNPKNDLADLWRSENITRQTICTKLIP